MSVFNAHLTSGQVRVLLLGYCADIPTINKTAILQLSLIYACMYLQFTVNSAITYVSQYSVIEFVFAFCVLRFTFCICFVNKAQYVSV